VTARKLLTEEEAAQSLGVSARTLDVLERRGLIRERSGGWAYLNETGLQCRAIIQEQKP